MKKLTQVFLMTVVACGFVHASNNENNTNVPNPERIKQQRENTLNQQVQGKEDLKKQIKLMKEEVNLFKNIRDAQVETEKNFNSLFIGYSNFLIGQDRYFDSLKKDNILSEEIYEKIKNQIPLIAKDTYLMEEKTKENWRNKLQKHRDSLKETRKKLQEKQNKLIQLNKEWNRKYSEDNSFGKLPIGVRNMIMFERGELSKKEELQKFKELGAILVEEVDENLPYRNVLDLKQATKLREEDSNMQIIIPSWLLDPPYKPSDLNDPKVFKANDWLEMESEIEMQGKEGYGTPYKKMIFDPESIAHMPKNREEQLDKFWHKRERRDQN